MLLQMLYTFEHKLTGSVFFTHLRLGDLGELPADCLLLRCPPSRKGRLPRNPRPAYHANVPSETKNKIALRVFKIQRLSDSAGLDEADSMGTQAFDGVVCRHIHPRTR
jgi:hypothetical protein